MAIRQILQNTAPRVEVTFSRRPASVACAVYDSNNTLLAEPTITLGLSTTTICPWGISNLNPRTFQVASTARMNWLNKLLIISPAKSQQSITVISAGADGYVDIQEELVFDFPAGSTIESPDAYAHLTTTETATDQSLKIRFTATMPSGEIEIQELMYDVVAHILEQPITIHNLSKIAPGLHRLMDEQMRGTDWADLLESVWETVFRDLVRKGIKASRIMDEAQMKDVMLYKFQQRLCESGLKMSAEDIPLVSAKYFASQYDAILNGTASAIEDYDSNDDGARDSSGWPKRNRRVL